MSEKPNGHRLVALSGLGHRAAKSLGADALQVSATHLYVLSRPYSPGCASSNLKVHGEWKLQP